MLKHIIKGLAVGAAVFAIAGAAHAATIDINLYGASAQFLFWNDAADNFLASRTPACTGIAQDQYNGAHGITRGTCSGNTVYIRYSSKASYDGIYAVKGSADTDSCGSAFQRKMVNETTCPWDGTGGTNCTALKCVDVVLGASDVAGESFIQSSTGQLKGPAGGGSTSRTFSGISTSGLVSYNPLVVPFGFFANNTVTKTKCLSPDPKEPTPGADKAISSWGNQCYDPDGDGKSADCIGYYKCTGGVCTGGVNAGQACARANQCPDVTLQNTNCQRIPLDNISRLQALMIFSGQAVNWKDFGDWYPNLPIVACLRHAGSGTHATMDLAVMSGLGWGWNIATVEKAANPVIWFNDGSSDMMNCISTTNGAIGYADADQLAGSNNYLNVHALKYQGIEPKRAKIRNGEYDFWSVQWIYEQASNRPSYVATHPWVQQLMTFAANPLNVPTTKADYWATADEMVYSKASDFVVPGYQGAVDPQVP
jgi:hypothetical protein